MSVSDALLAVRGRVQAAAQQWQRRAPRLVAVSKTKPVAALMEAYEAGQRHFGENYVQELLQKAPEMPADVQWHYIGNLQSNKAKQIVAVPNLYLVESVDRAKLADLLNKHLPEERDRLRVMVQVNTSGEESKSGVEPAGCVDLVRHVVTNCSRLHFVGLMTIGRLGEVHPTCFEALVKCRDEVLSSDIPGLPAPDDFELSMGMSGDFELAIQLGSTNVRVGSTIFGARNYAAGPAAQGAAAAAPGATPAAAPEGTPAAATAAGPAEDAPDSSDSKPQAAPEK